MNQESKHMFSTLVVLLFLLINNLDAAELSGKVSREPAQTNSVDQVNRYDDRFSELSKSDCKCNPGDYAVVYLTSDNLPEITLSDSVPTMKQKNMKFEPSVLTVAVGTTVEFPNLDPFYHNVFSYSKTKKFDLGRFPKGKSEFVTFDKPGIVKVFCEIHFPMRAYVHILETPYFATSDENGKFTIKDINPGEYTLHVWQENLPDILRPITIEEGNNIIEVE